MGIHMLILYQNSASQITMEEDQLFEIMFSNCTLKQYNAMQHQYLQSWDSILLPLSAFPAKIVGQTQKETHRQISVGIIIEVLVFTPITALSLLLKAGDVEWTSTHKDLWS